MNHKNEIRQMTPLWVYKCSLATVILALAVVVGLNLSLLVGAA